MKQTEYMSVRAAARALGIGLKRVYELLYDERLVGAQKREGRWQIPLGAVRARVKDRRGDSGPAGC